MKKIYFKLSVVLFTFILLTNCEDEINTSDLELNKKVETVKINEALNFLNTNTDLVTKKSGSKPYVVPDTKLISQESLIASDQLMTVIPATTIYKNHYSRILLLKINNEIKSVVFSMYRSKHIKTEKFSGEIIITDLKGVFLNGYSVNNGKLIAQFKSKVKKNKASLFFSSSISAFFQNSGTCQYHGPCYDSSECIMCNQNLEEVVLIAGGSTDAGISVTNIYFNGPSGGGDFNDAEETISWIAGGESGGGFEDEEKEDDWIRDHIEELCSDTNSTNNSSQNFSIEEPRWGQLANKEEILDEIAKVIEKTNGLAPVPQMMALKKHFGANLRFNPRTNTPFIEEDNIDVNRYVYTTEGGWLDFNHVFAAFNLTYDVGVHYALLGGKVMEEIQAMRENNHSAYAYEDLTSNYVGTYMFTKYWDDISDGNITYEKMVSEILDELGVVDPEDAPNFDYIPAYMDSNYPKNYSFKPITGNDLLEAAKKAFCNKDEKDKIKNIKARENYKR